ncbi:MAG TPA: hypothetical protein VMH39_02835 [Gemmatimonadaceae bacterium]|nr:hypothetical protein [Gemmatimonadaceae bacterium]
MKISERLNAPRRRPIAGPLVAGVLLGAASLHAQASLGGYGSTTDPRVGLKGGFLDAATAAKGMELVGHVPKADTFNIAPPGGLTFANSDLAFQGNFVFQGNFSGFMIWDVSDPTKPKLRAAFDCPTSQGDPSVYGNLLFISSESTGDRRDCSTPAGRGGGGRGGRGGGRGAAAADSAAGRGAAGADTGARAGAARGAGGRGAGGRGGGGGRGGRAGGAEVLPDTGKSIGIRIFDISDIDHPKHVFDVQTCRGSHTNTLVPDPLDKGVVYIYVQGTNPIRPSSEMASCTDLGPVDTNPKNARFRLEVIRVPLAHPEKSAVVAMPRVFDKLEGVASHGQPEGARGGGGRGGGGRGGFGGRGIPGIDTLTPTSTAKDSARYQRSMDSVRDLPRTGPQQCHDLTAYPAIGLAGGACAGLGLLLDIKDPAHPRRITAVGDSNFSFWHSATFSNDGKKILFTDELGGGTAPECLTIDPMDWGGDAIFTIDRLEGTLTQHAYFKMPAVQTAQENCVAHNGGLVPVPGRDIMAQAWYQGGVDVYDWTDPNHPFEIAYFDRGPIDSTRLVTGGSWCLYWYNGRLYSSEIARGLDVFELKPGPLLSQNEIDAAKLVHLDRYNPQSQPKIVWPAAFPVVRSYLDQLVRDKGLPSLRTDELERDINAAEKLSGAAQRAALTKVATGLDADLLKGPKDVPRVKAMAAAVRALAGSIR